MASQDSEVVHALLTMKLVTSVNDEYGMAVTMIKYTLLSSCLSSADAEIWVYVVSAMRED